MTLSHVGVVVCVALIMTQFSWAEDDGSRITLLVTLQTDDTTTARIRHRIRSCRGESAADLEQRAVQRMEASSLTMGHRRGLQRIGAN